MLLRIYKIDKMRKEELLDFLSIFRLTMLTVEDFFITSVSREKEEGSRPAKILMSDKKSLHLPPEMSAIHLEHTEYFFDHPTSIPSKIL